MEPLASPTTPPLYSTNAIRGFSILFSAVAGGALLAHNLKKVGQPQAARLALWGSIAYTALIIGVLLLLPDDVGNRLGLFTGLLGGVVLAGFYERKVPDLKAYPAKSIIKPLVICLLIITPIILLILLPLFVQ